MSQSTIYTAEQNYFNSIAGNPALIIAAETALTDAQMALAADEATISDYTYLNDIYGLSLQNSDLAASLESYYGWSNLNGAGSDESAYGAAYGDAISRIGTIVTEEGSSLASLVATAQLTTDGQALSKVVGNGYTVQDLVDACYYEDDPISVVANITGLTTAQVMGAIATGLAAISDETIQNLTLSIANSTNTGNNLNVLNGEYPEITGDNAVIANLQNAVQNPSNQSQLGQDKAILGNTNYAKVLDLYNQGKSAATIDSTVYGPGLTTQEIQVINNVISILASYTNIENVVTSDIATAYSQVGGGLSGVYGNLESDWLRATGDFDKIGAANKQISDDQAVIAKYDAMVKLYNSLKAKGWGWGTEIYTEIAKEQGITGNNAQIMQYIKSGITAYNLAAGDLTIQQGVVNSAQADLMSLANNSSPYISTYIYTTLGNNTLDALTNAQNQLTGDQATITHYQWLIDIMNGVGITGINIRGIEDRLGSKDIKGALQQYYQALGDKGVQLGNITTYQNDLLALPTIGANFSSLFAAVNQMNSEGLNNNIFANDSSRTQFMSMMNTILQAMQYHLEENVISLMMAEYPNMTAAQAQAGFSLYLGALNNENSLLMNLITQGQKNIVDWNLFYDNANVDSHNYTTVEVWFQGAGHNQAEDRWRMNLATQMISLITKLVTNLAQEIAQTSMASMAQMVQILQQLQQQIISIMNDPNMSVSEKANKVLPLVFLMLSLFDAFKAQVASSKANNQKLMSDGALAAAQMRIQDSQANLQIQQEEQHNQRVMKIFMTVVTVLMTVLMCVTGQLELIPLILAFAAYDLANQWGPKTANVTQALGGGVQGDAIWSAIEAAATMGVGVGLKMTVTKGAERGMAVGAEEGAAKGSEGAAGSSAKEGAGATGSVEEEVTIEDLDEIGMPLPGKTQAERLEEFQKAKTLETNRAKLRNASVKKYAALFANQGVDVIWSSWSKLPKVAQKLYREVEDVLLKEVPGGGKFGESATDAEIEEAASKIVAPSVTLNNAIESEITKPSLFKQAWKWLNTIQTKEEAEAEQLKIAQNAGDHSLPTMALRALWKTGTNFVMAAAINNTLVDEAAVIKRHSHLDDQQSQTLDIVMQILQAVLLMGVGYMKMSGSAGLDGMLSGPTLQMIENTSQMGLMGAEGATSLVEGQTTMAQADVSTAAQIIRAILDMIFTSLDRQQKISQNDQNNLSQQIGADSNSNRQLQENVLSGWKAGIEVLQSSAV